MKINIFINDQFYKEKDYGANNSYNIGDVIREVTSDYKAGLIDPSIAPTPNYKLSIDVIE